MNLLLHVAAADIVDPYPIDLYGPENLLQNDDTIRIHHCHMHCISHRGIFFLSERDRQSHKELPSVSW